MYLNPQKYCLSSCKSADACADAETEWCSYVLYDASFCNSADEDTDADRAILAIMVLVKPLQCVEKWSFYPLKKTQLKQIIC